MDMSVELSGRVRRVVAPLGVHGKLVFRVIAAIVSAPIMMGGVAGAGPVINPAYTSNLRLSASAAGVGHVTQFAAGPDGRIYASTSDRGVLSFKYNAASGKLTDERSVSSLSGLGIGFQKSTGQMYLSTFDGSIYRLSDDNHNGLWGESGETRVPIVQNLPPGDHNVDNIQIVGDTLYVGIGNRTINGGTGVNTGGSIDDFGGKGMFFHGTGTTFGESAYNGTISWIQDLKAVPSTPNAAGLFTDNSQATIQSNSLPFTSDDPGKLVVHSAGTRNPFGLAVDASGSLYFTNNYNRAETNGDGTANEGHYADAVGASLKNAVYDQFFKAVPGADYGFRNENWRDNTPVLTPGSPGYDHQKSITFDNLYSSDPNFLQTYDPTHPVGLGPSSSSDGVAFSYNSLLPTDLVGDAFVARYNPSVKAQDGETLIYSDLVAIDPVTGLMSQVAAGFKNPSPCSPTPTAISWSPITAPATSISSGPCRSRRR